MNEQEVLHDIAAWARENGYTVGTYTRGPGQHRAGLPPCVMLKPEWTPVDGDHAVCVTPRSVLRAVLHTPFNFSTWKTVGHQDYATLAELKAILETPGFIHIDPGCWSR